MPIDKSELVTEIEKGGDIQSAAVEALQKKGFSIYDKAKHDEFVATTKREFEASKQSEIAAIHTQYDSDIESALGVKKNANEKSYDYLKRAASAKLGDLNTKITDLEKVIKEKGDPTGVLQKKIDELENRAASAIKERDEKIEALTKTSATAMKGVLMANEYAEISKSFTKDLPKMFERTKKIILDDLLASSVVKDGILYMGDGTGGIKRDSSFKEILISDVLKTEFKDVIDAGRVQTGSGSKGVGKPDDNVDPSTYNVDNFQMPSDVKTQGDVVEAMLKVGIQKGSDAFKAIFNKYALGIEIVTDGDKKIRKQVGKALPM